MVEGFHFRSNFFIFLETGKKSDFFRENIGFFIFFFGKISDFSDFSAKNRRFFPIFFLSIFFLSKSFPCRPKTDFSPINRPKNPIFCSLVVSKGTFQWTLVIES